MAWLESATLVFAGISAVGVAAEAWQRWSNRELLDVDAQITGVLRQQDGSPAATLKVAAVRNLSSVPIRRVQVLPAGGVVPSSAHGWHQVKVLEPEDVEQFIVETDDVDAGWFLIGFITGTGRRDRVHLTWCPMNPEGALAEHRARQILLPRWKAALIRTASPPIPSPVTRATGRGSRGSRSIAELRLRESSRRPPSGWQLRLAQRLSPQPPTHARVQMPAQD